MIINPELKFDMSYQIPLNTAQSKLEMMGMYRTDSIFRLKWHYVCVQLTEADCRWIMYMLKDEVGHSETDYFNLTMLVYAAKDGVPIDDNPLRGFYKSDRLYDILNTRMHFMYYIANYYNSKEVNK